EQVQRSVRGFIGDELRHYRTSTGDMVADPKLDFPFKALYLVLRTYANSHQGEGDEHSDVGQTLEEALDIFSSEVVRAQANLDCLRGQLGEQQRQAADGQRALESLQTQVEAGRERLRQQAEEREQLEKTLRGQLGEREEALSGQRAQFEV